MSRIVHVAEGDKDGRPKYACSCGLRFSVIQFRDDHSTKEGHAKGSP